ncbi:MAG: Tetratricopeptide repeat protein [Deltaproteobacteria bacterium ADurb.Bin510]|nr:MAG: Tetratricopeptide repeat protein [Deltaproteobacteria bacterium ADurb.Bin510]
MPPAPVLTEMGTVLSFKEALHFWPLVAAGLGNAYLCLLAVGVVFFVLAAGACAFKYSPLLYQDLQHRTSHALPKALIWLMLGLLLFWPLLLDAGPLWLGLWWLPLFWGYLRRREQRLAYGLAAFVALGGLLAQVGGGFVSYAATQANREIFAVEHGIETGADIARLAAFASAQPRDAAVTNARAVVALRKADYRGAASLLKRALELEPDNPRYYNHLGVALAGLKNPGEAAKAFGNSMRLEAGNPIYAYNLSRLQLSEFKFYESEKAVLQASAIDAPRIRRLLEAEKHEARESFVVSAMPVVLQLRRQFKLSPELEQAAAGLWRLPAGLVPAQSAPLVALAFLTLLAIVHQVPTDKFSKVCSRCGRVHYVGVLSGRGLPMCMQCEWLDSRKDRSQNAIVDHKTSAIKDYRLRQASRARHCELVLPGLGALLAEQTGRAFRTLLCFSLGLVLLISGAGFIAVFLPHDFALTGWLRGLGALLLVALYWRAWRFNPAGL